MKKITGKIAIVLVIILIANSLTGCFTVAAYSSNIGQLGLVAWIGTIPLDIVTSPIQLVIFIVEITQAAELSRKAKSMDHIDTFSLSASFIHQAEFLSLTEKFNSLPKTDIAAFTNTVESFSETEISAVIEAFNDLSEEIIFSSIETLNLMTDEMLIAQINNSQYIEFRSRN